MCPGWGEKYIDKTEKCLISRMNEHGKQENESMFKHLSECEMFKETCNLYAFPSVYNEQDQNEISLTSHILSAVLQNQKILDVNYNLSKLLFLEACYTKKHNPVINHDLKASKKNFCCLIDYNFKHSVLIYFKCFITIQLLDNTLLLNNFYLILAHLGCRHYIEI